MRFHSKSGIHVLLNWSMVVLAIFWTGYLFYRMMDPPATTPAVFSQVPIETIRNPVPGANATGQVPPGAPLIQGPSATLNPAPATGSTQPKVFVRDDAKAPAAFAPVVPIKPLNPALLPSGAGPDF